MWLQRLSLGTWTIKKLDYIDLSRLGKVIATINEIDSNNHWIKI